MKTERLVTSAGTSLPAGFAGSPRRETVTLLPASDILSSRSRCCSTDIIVVASVGGLLKDSEGGSGCAGPGASSSTLASLAMLSGLSNERRNLDEWTEPCIGEGVDETGESEDMYGRRSVTIFAPTSSGSSVASPSPSARRPYTQMSRSSC